MDREVQQDGHSLQKKVRSLGAKEEVMRLSALKDFRQLENIQLIYVDMNRLKRECGKTMQSCFGTLVNLRTCKPKP